MEEELENKNETENKNSGGDSIFLIPSMTCVLTILIWQMVCYLAPLGKELAAIFGIIGLCTLYLTALAAIVTRSSRKIKESK